MKYKTLQDKIADSVALIRKAERLDNFAANVFFISMSVFVKYLNEKDDEK